MYHSPTRETAKYIVAADDTMYLVSYARCEVRGARFALSARAMYMRTLLHDPERACRKRATSLLSLFQAYQHEEEIPPQEVSSSLR